MISYGVCPESMKTLSPDKQAARAAFEKKLNSATPAAAATGAGRTGGENEAVAICPTVREVTSP